MTPTAQPFSKPRNSDGRRDLAAPIFHMRACCYSCMRFQVRRRCLTPPCHSRSTASRLSPNVWRGARRCAPPRGAASGEGATHHPPPLTPRLPLSLQVALRVERPPPAMHASIAAQENAEDAGAFDVVAAFRQLGAEIVEADVDVE